MIKKDFLGNFDFILIGVVGLIVLIGCLMIYSGGFDSINKINSGLFKKQVLWILVGFLAMFLVSFLNYQLLGTYSLYIYGSLLIILLFTTVFGQPIRNTRAWINFGVFSIQPSEFMKLGLVIFMARVLELRERDLRNFRELLIPSILTFIPIVIILRQPDFGTAFIFIPILFVMLYLAGADVLHLLSIISIAVIALVVPMVLTYREWIGARGSNLVLDFFNDPTLLFIVSGILLIVSFFSYLGYFLLIKNIFRRIYISSLVLSLGLFFSVVIQNLFKEYQKKRILVFLNPKLDPYGSGYNIIQSKIAIGSGGFLGKGFLEGTQAQLGFLPEKTSDFIFSVLAEEWGFLGGMVMIVLFLILLFRCIQISLEAKDKFGALVASGITAIFFFHIVVNIGMVIGIMPVTGLPLCFVSYGGSNLIVSMIGIGILNNIQMKKFIN